MSESTFDKEFRSKLNNNEKIADFEKENILNIEKVIEKYNNYIYTILKNAVPNEDDIEEILSDVFTVLWKNYLRLDKNINIRAYLIGIAKNLIKKKYRSYIRETESIDDIENTTNADIDIEELIEENEKSKIISILIDNMKEEEKQIFTMFYYKGNKVKEIAKLLNITETKVKVTLHRLRKQVRKDFKERGYDYGK